MQEKAQAGLEYLMTYGWALVLVATVVGTLVFILGSPTDENAFQISDPTKFLIKGGQLIGDQALVKLQNITGGEIEITDLLTSGYTDCSINDNYEIEGITISPGGEIKILCTLTQESTKTITVEYEDQLGLEDTVTVTSSGGNTPLGPGGETICDDGFDNDGDTLIDCADPNCHGAQGTGGTCEYGEELTCNDLFDNDADTFTDCLDEDCYEDPACSEEEELCDVIGDEDGDSLADCLDPDCVGQYCDAEQTKVCHDNSCVAGFSLTECGTITQSGTYVLGQDIIGEEDPPCITISASNIILDCQGKNIAANKTPDFYVLDTPYATVHIEGDNNVTITNCIISSATSGIWTGYYGSDIAVSNNTIIGCSGKGILVNGGEVEITGNTITNNSEGIHLEYYEASDIEINGNVVCGNTAHGHVYDIRCDPWGEPATGTGNQISDGGTFCDNVQATACPS